MKTLKHTLLTLAALCSAGQASLILHYSFDEGSGSVVTDSSGNSRDSLLNSGSWNATGQFGGSLNLGSTVARAGGSYDTTISSLQTVTGNQVTIAFWANANIESVGSNPFLLNDSNNSSGNRIFGSHLEWTNGQTYFDVGYGASGSATYDRINGDIGLVSDQMHHYVYTYDGDAKEMYLYKDNVQVLGSTTVAGGNLKWADIQNFQLGALSFENGNWAGEMDDFAIWDEVLDTTDRTEVFTNGVAALAVPEPSSTALLGLGGLALILRRRR